MGLSDFLRYFSNLIDLFLCIDQLQRVFNCSTRTLKNSGIPFHKDTLLQQIHRVIMEL